MKGLLALCGLVLVAITCAHARSLESPPWVVVRTSRFEVYSQAGIDSARATLVQFERLQAFFDRNGLIQGSAALGAPPLRIISFGSVKEYESFRFRPNADAYYASSGGQAYIVMPGIQGENFAIEAHEYAHYYLQAAGLKLPPWLNEGLPEFFSTIRFTDRGCTLGGRLPRRLETLNRRKWLPLPDLLALSEDSPLLKTREGAELFYAESWALTDLLIESPEYASRFRDLIAQLNSGTPSATALTAIYGKSLDAISKDWHTRVEEHKFPIRIFPPIPVTGLPVEISELSEVQSTALLADLLMADGKLDRAESLYADLEQQSPGDLNALAALGNIAVREHDRVKAIQYWREAIDKGIDDADLCYRYAVLAEETGLPADEIRHALERAVTLNPGFADARYKLALLESNAGEFAAAVTQLRAIRTVSPARAFSYWTALSYASMESGDRVAAKNAAQEAGKCAHSASDRLRAMQLAYVADTDLAVQFERDADGHARLVETRVPHGTSDWNPFIEPTDRIRKTEGQLREVLCTGGKLSGFLLDTSNGRLALAVPDPRRVFMHSGPAAFTCGLQTPKRIEVEYATAYATAESGGIVRGIAFP